MERDRYIVEGLKSEVIKKEMKNALENIEGVNGVAVDLGRGMVDVIYSNPDISEKIRECIENVGYLIQ